MHGGLGGIHYCLGHAEFSGMHSSVHRVTCIESAVHTTAQWYAQLSGTSCAQDVVGQDNQAQESLTRLFVHGDARQPGASAKGQETFVNAMHDQAWEYPASHGANK